MRTTPTYNMRTTPTYNMRTTPTYNMRTTPLYTTATFTTEALCLVTYLQLLLMNVTFKVMAYTLLDYSY